MHSVEFTVDTAMAAAREKAGLFDFGSDEFIAPLERYLQALREEVNFSEQGRLVSFGEVTQHLVTRLRIEDHFKRFPQIADERIVQPVFVVGLFRSGTTKLHRLLCSDSRWMYLPLWQAIFPAPLDDIFNGAADTRIAMTEQYLEQMATMAPGTLQAHPMETMSPEEEWLLMTQSFLTQNISQQTPIYSRWIEQQDVTPMYRYLYRQLQIVQWQQRMGDPARRRFCLKAPAHLEHIDTLMKVFPDAKVLFTHRDPASSIASNCKLIESLYELYSDRFDLHALGQEILHTAARALDNSLQSRSHFPDGTFFEVTFADLVARPLELIPAIYRYVDMPLTDTALEAIRRGEDEAVQHKSTESHRYDAARYGLNKTMIYERTARYLQWVRTTLQVDLQSR